MTMSTNATLLPWLLLLSVMISSAPSLGTSVLLLFDTGAPNFNLQNCSCSTSVQDCDEELVESLCKCHTFVVDSAASPAGLRVPGRLSVWVKELGVVTELLGRSTIGHLRLSYCGTTPVSGGTLALLGLQTLTVRTAAPGAAHPEQTLTLSPPAGVAAELEDWGISHMSVLDVAVMNGRSALKSFSVLGASAATLHQHFPHLAPPPAHRTLDQLLITFVY